MAGNKNSGRKLKLNQELIDKACELLVDGNYAVIVCRVLNISENAWYSWVNQGIKDIEEGKTSIFAKFYESIMRAEAQAEADAVKNIKLASVSDPKHAQWFLSHKAKERWADKIDLQMTVEQKAPDPIALEAEFNQFKQLQEGKASEVKAIEGEFEVQTNQ